MIKIGRIKRHTSDMAELLVDKCVYGLREPDYHIHPAGSSIFVVVQLASPKDDLARHSDEQKANKQKASCGQDKPSGLS
jgi:hypothetical protein